ncbi:TPA: replication initiation protein [Neisseria gonorrhoeae]
MSQLYTQPDLFLQERIPHKPYCKDFKEAPMLVRSYAAAIKRRYIQVNPPHLRVFMLFDLDYEGAGLAWEDNNLPMPAWAAINRENGGAHLAYALSAPVLTAEYGGRQKALRYLAALEAAYKAKLRGDVGFVSLITKNPEHPHWLTLRGVPDAIRGYDLEYLADFVDLDKFKPYIGRSNVEAVGLSRNCTVFNLVSRWAHKNVLAFKQQGYTVQDWLKEVHYQCMRVNGDFPVPMWEKEVKCISKSIANWVWYKFDIAASNRRFSELQAHRNSLRKTTINAGRTKIITEL